MSLTETQFERIAGGVNEAYLALNHAQGRDPFVGREIAMRSPIFYTSEGIDHLVPPFSGEKATSSACIVPLGLEITVPDVSALEIDGVVGIASDSRDGEPDKRRWKLTASVEGDEARYFVERTARNGDKYVFKSSNPELATRAAEILLSRLSQDIDAWGTYQLAS